MNLLLELGLLTVASAQDDPGGDVDAIGFGDVEERAVGPSVPTSPWHLGGGYDLDAAMWAEPRDDVARVSKLRNTVDLTLSWSRPSARLVASAHAEADPVYLLGPQMFDPQTVETHGWQLWPRDLYLAVGDPSWELLVGRHLTGWGEGLLLSPLDVDARDLREPGMADLEDLRLPSAGIRLGVHPGPHSLELTWRAEVNPGLRSPPNGPFGPLPALAPAVYGEADWSWDFAEPRLDLESQQLLGRWSWRGRGLDLALHAAHLRDTRGVLVLPELIPPLPEALEVQLDALYYGLVGVSGSAAAGPVVLRWEGSVEIERPLNTGDLAGLPPTLQIERTSAIGGMAGLSWQPWPTALVVLETSGRTIFEDLDLLWSYDAEVYAARVAQTAWDDRIAVSVSATGLGWDLRYGGYARADLSWEFAESQTLTVGGIVYRPGSSTGLLVGLDQHDTLFSQLSLRL